MAKAIICALGLAFCLGLTPSAKADEPGYFLSWQQKKDLVWLGCMQDAAGTWYDVWICPGYVPPAHYAKEHLKMAGGNFYEYFEINKYRSLKEGSKACFEWALKDCGLDFTVKGIPRAWGEHFTVANVRTERRVFGWWLAYPWAFFESSVETAFRAALGSVGTVGGVASGLAIVPAYHALDSAVAGVWNLGVNTIIIPAAGVTWNTLVSPPLALIGQKPSESRVDGFWVTILSETPEHAVHKLTPEEVRLLGQWGLVLLRETRPLSQKQHELEKSAAEQEAKLRSALQAAQAETVQKRVAVQQEKQALIQRLAATNEQATAVWSQQPGLTPGGTTEADLRQYLQSLNIPSKDIEGVLRLLRTYRPPGAGVSSPMRSKTDPLQRSVDVIGHSAVDALK
jgi:hypothetical protein